MTTPNKQIMELKSRLKLEKELTRLSSEVIAELKEQVDNLESALCDKSFSELALIQAEALIEMRDYLFSYDDDAYIEITGYLKSQLKEKGNEQDT